MSSRPVVFADTNVLYPYLMSDLILWLASNGVIRVIWTQYLVEEVIEVVPRRFLAKGRGRDEATVRSQWDAARRHLRCDEVTEDQWRSRLHLTSGPDLDDHPHQAAAMYAHAEYLITGDRKGFPAAKLLGQGITVTRIDAFMCRLLETEHDEVILTVITRVKEFRAPPYTLAEYLGHLSKTAPQFATMLADELGERIPLRTRLRLGLGRALRLI